MTTTDLRSLLRAADALEPGAALDLHAFGLAAREPYLGFVRDWKSAWHETVRDIRLAKRRRKMSAPDYDPSAQSARERLRVRARRLLVLRHAARMGSLAAREAARLAA